MCAFALNRLGVAFNGRRLRVDVYVIAVHCRISTTFVLWKALRDASASCTAARALLAAAAAFAGPRAKAAVANAWIGLEDRTVCSDSVPRQRVEREPRALANVRVCSRQLGDAR